LLFGCAVALRGLFNLGSTCFMNSVMQTLAHNPPFRNFFLGYAEIACVLPGWLPFLSIVCTHSSSFLAFLYGNVGTQSD
jgi:hypothetical protein